MSQILVTGEAKIRDIQGPVVANSGVVTALDGDASQYVRGDGTLADFPTSTGGGSSVSYYLNSSVSQGTIGGVAYRQLSKTPISGAGTDITASTNGYIASYITDANDPALLEVPAGNFNCEFYFSVNSNAHNPYVYAELYKYDGTTFTLLGSNQAIPEYLTNGTTLSAYYFAIPVAVAALTITDRLSIRIYVNVDGRVVTLHTENNHLCQVVTTFSKGLISLNNLTRQNQFFATGTDGTDFNISSATATHTFNIPSASATNRGLITTGSQTIAGDKSFTGINSFDYGINYKTGASLANVSGYISQAYATSGTGASSTLSLKISDGNSVKAINLDFVGSPATYTYTYPAFSGTLALLEGSQTFSGAKTFSAATKQDAGILLKNGFTTYSNSYTSLAGNIGNLIISGSISGTPFDNELTFTPSTSNTFTFPNASGTLALTSNLSAYVPYTGATTNVNLGSNDILVRRLYLNTNNQGVYAKDSLGSLYQILALNSSDKVSIDQNGLGTIFGGSIIADGSVLLKNNVTSFLTGYVNLGGIATGYGFSVGLPNGGAPLINELRFNSSAAYNYTFPAASGTIALTSNLSNFVPYTGAIASVNLGAFYLTAQFITGTGGFETGLGTGLYLRSNSTATYLSTGYVSLVSNNGNNFNIAYGSSTKEAVLVGSSLTASRSFTFPDATGTIALTSNLSAYLPLAGGTLTGALSGTTATFSGLGTFYQLTMTGATAGRIFYAQTGGVVSQSGNLNWNETNGMLGVGTPNPSAVITAFSTNAATHFKAAGVAPAFTFSNTLTSPTLGCVFGLATSSNQFITGTAAGDMAIANQSASAGAIVFGTGTTEKIRMNSVGRFLIGTSADNGALLQVAGAATFSSSVTANSGVQSQVIGSDGTYGASYPMYSFTGTTNGSSRIFCGTGSDFMYFAAGTGSGFQFRPNASTSSSFTIASTGAATFSSNVGIGGASLTSLWQGQFLQISTDLIVGRLAVNGYSYLGHNVAFNGSNFKSINGGSGCLIGYSGAGGFNIDFASGAAAAGDTYTTYATKFSLTNAGAATFSSLGTGAVTATGGTLSTTSDMNLKIEDGFIDNALDKILKLTPRYFLWKEESGLPTDLRQLGFYAQEVNEALGEEVANTPKTENDSWGIYDRGIIAMLTKGMQEQQAQIEDLKQLIKNK